MRKLALIIMDGWGIGEPKLNNAIYVAKTPFYDYLWNNFPHTILQASEEYVGLPKGQIGGSEVGHLTIGAGRILYQTLVKIDRSFAHRDADESILKRSGFQKLLGEAKKKQIHIIGLVSPGGVHSHENHLLQLLEIMKMEGCKSPYIHFVSDGRDVPPTSGIESAKRLLNKIEDLKFGSVVSLVGRFYAMDRDHNYDRTKKALDLFTNTSAHHDVHHHVPHKALVHAFEKSYARDITDEFVEPVAIDPEHTGIQNGDTLFLFNFRSDRMKQLVTAAIEKHPGCKIYTMTEYDKSYTYDVIFDKENITGTLGEVLSKHNLVQLRAAETEKFPHVTYFFNGGTEIVFDGELRSLAESNKVRHDTMPEMKAAEIESNVETTVKGNHPDFILINFANPDMVGHTGNFKAAVRGVETVDAQMKKICAMLTENKYICCITADHGNADIMYDLQTLEPHTAHTLNPVPFIIYDPHDKHNQQIKLDQTVSNGLSKIAGTVMDLMKIPRPQTDFESLIL